MICIGLEVYSKHFFCQKKTSEYQHLKIQINLSKKKEQQTLKRQSFINWKIWKHCRNFPENLQVTCLHYNTIEKTELKCQQIKFQAILRFQS